MKKVFIRGWGAVSPAGWSVDALRDAAAKGEPLGWSFLERPGRKNPLRVLRVPAPIPRAAFLNLPRLRRASAITRFAAGAALEAMGDFAGASETGVILCVFSGCVNYSRRFYEEVLRDPATASPMLFPETVFNAPASHVSACLASTAINYTLVGDVGTFLAGLALAARWLEEEKVRQCLVVGAEEMDWLTADALRLFDPETGLSEGAGALLLTAEENASGVVIQLITDEHLYPVEGKRAALERMRRQLGSSPGLLLDSVWPGGAISREEEGLWRDWTHSRMSLKRVFGEGLMASSAWQAVLAADAIEKGVASDVILSVAGLHQHALGARFTRHAPGRG